MKLLEKLYFLSLSRLLYQTNPDLSFRLLGHRISCWIFPLVIDSVFVFLLHALPKAPPVPQPYLHGLLVFEGNRAPANVPKNR